MNKMDGMSMDLKAENIAQLKALFPEAVTEGKVDFEVLKALLGGEIEQRQEYYKFTWNGKEAARAYARTRSMGTLRPCVEESSGKDGTPGKFDSDNLYIEGDNLEVLKLLQGPYHKKVKMIYIDPPYNTGKDFVYPDNFKDSIGNYKALTGQTDDEGKSTRANPETSGRYHTDWLNMMYPRLILARNLLSRDGVIFISIDDNEFANLKSICDNVFGEENFIGEIIWQTATDNNASQISIEHEYIIAYAKEKDLHGAWEKPSVKIKAILEKYAELKQRFSNDFEVICQELRKWINVVKKTHEVDLGGVAHYNYVDEKGVFYPGNSANTKPGGYTFDIIHPVDNEVCAKPDNGYRWPLATFEEADRRGDVLWGDDHNSIPKIKKRAETAMELLKSVYYEDNRATTKSLTALMGGKVFDNPKSTQLISTIMSFVLKTGDIILDFFAGSSTTAEAAMRNAIEMEMDLKFILVQLPETTYEIKNGKKVAKKDSKVAFSMGYETICEIGKERIRRAAKKIKGEHPDWSGDMGFKVFKLDTSNLLPWNPNAEELEQNLFAAVDNVLEGRTTDDLLHEILLKCNLPLTLPIEKKQCGSNTIYLVGAGALAICLDKNIPATIAEEIVRLRDEYAPIVPMQVVFRDNGFNDVTKTNALQILKQAGFEEKSIQTI